MIRQKRIEVLASDDLIARADAIAACTKRSIDDRDKLIADLAVALREARDQYDAERKAHDITFRGYETVKAERDEFRERMNNISDDATEELKEVYAERDRANALLCDLVELADAAMQEANNDGCGYARQAELEAARAHLRGEGGRS